MKKEALVSLMVGIAAQVAFGSVLEKGESVAFMGDSITQFGWGAGGYVRLCDEAFKANGLDVTTIPAGISGNKSNDMLARLEKDILSKKPTYMTLSCGVNDVWHQDTGRGIELSDYKKNITELIDWAQAAGVKVIVLTATMIGEDQKRVQNQKLVPYNGFLREIAKEKGCTLVDLNAEMQRRLAAFKAKTDGCPRHYLTTDGVHMDFLGNRMMAQMILKDGFKFTDAELAKSEEAWKKQTLRIGMPWAYMSAEAYLRQAEKALEEKSAPTHYIQQKIGAFIEEKVKEL